MKIRALLTLTAIVSSILGAIAVYLVLSVPNDLRADALLKEARKDVTDGNHERARESLSKIVQQYPRTDAAAAATLALISLGQREREELSQAVSVLRRQNEQQTQLIYDLQRSTAELKSGAARPAAVAPPAPAAARKAPAKKTTTAKTTKKKTTPKRPRRK
jgi:TolA-binding protein